jgi:hypothetical protein
VIGAVAVFLGQSRDSQQVARSTGKQAGQVHQQLQPNPETAGQVDILRLRALGT